MKLKLVDWETILDSADITEDSVRLDYSGRAMYGRACPGFTGDISTFGRFMAAIGRANADEEENGSGRPLAARPPLLVWPPA